MEPAPKDVQQSRADMIEKVNEAATAAGLAAIGTMPNKGAGPIVSPPPLESKTSVDFRERMRQKREESMTKTDAMVKDTVEREAELNETALATATRVAGQVEKEKEQTALDSKIALQNVNQLIMKLKSTPLGELGQNSVDVVMSFIRILGADMNDTDYYEGVPEEVAYARLALIRTLDKALDEASKYCQAATEHQLARHKLREHTERIRRLNEIKSSRATPKSTEDIVVDFKRKAEQMVVSDELRSLFAKQPWVCQECKHRNPGSCEQCEDCGAVRPGLKGGEEAYINFAMDLSTHLLAAYCCGSLEFKNVFDGDSDDATTGGAVNGTSDP